MKESKETEINTNELSVNLTQHDKLKTSLPVSKILKTTIKRYQFDVVGWTEYCIDNKDLKQNELPVYRRKPLENLHILNKTLTSYSTPSIKKIYESPNHYIQWLDEEYTRDQAFYEAILNNPDKSKTYVEDNLLNKEIDKSAENYLKTIEKRRINEEALIKGVQDEHWHLIKMSKYPKVQLGIILGATGASIVNNFTIYFINQLRASIGSSKTAFLSLTGPATWYEIDQCNAELEYFKKEILYPIIKSLKKLL
jgi:hypothetical protein